MNSDNTITSLPRYAKILNILFALVLLLGLVMRFYQYLMGRSLWEDETHLALNFMKYGYLRLMQPLDHIQGAPIFFILGVKTIIKIFGTGELAFRAVPFISSILTFPLFYYLVLGLTKNKATALISFFIFAVNVTLIYFATELKQYAVDVAIYVLMIFLVVTPVNYVVRYRVIILAVTGCLAILFSSVAFIVLFCIACDMALSWYNNKKINWNDFKILTPWLVVFLINYFLFIHNHPSTAEQRLNYSFAFCPTDVLSCEFSSFLKKTIEETFFTMLLLISKEYGFAYVLLFIFVVAIRHMIVHKKYTVLLFTCLPILLHLLLSAMHLYPFWYRLILYLVPCFICIMAYGITVIANFFTKRLHLSLGVLIVLVCCSFIVKESVTTFPMWPYEIKPMLDFINKNQMGKHVYITNPVNAYDYYQQRGYVKNPIHKPLPWNMTPSEYYELVSEEKSNYLLVYGQVVQFGYGEVIKDLERRNLVVSHFEYKAFAVSEIKPLEEKDSIVSKLDYKAFDPKHTFDNDNTIAMWGGSITSNPVLLKKGRYSLSVLSRGTPVASVFPHLSVFLNNTKIGDYDNTNNFSTAMFSFELEKDSTIHVGLTMENDTNTKDEDRNSFVKSIIIRAIGD